MELRPTALPGCFELVTPVRRDDRGTFVKVMNRDAYARLGLVTSFAEEYYSVSRAGVLRGMHFQTPPHEHTKVVYCARGRVTDVVLDLRVGSPTYGRHATFDLSADAGNLLYLPAGLAHGFYVPDGEALMVYLVTSGHSPAHDAGVRWDSAGIPWPDASPVLSERDRTFPTLAEFRSPFRYDPTGNPAPAADSAAAARDA